MQRSLGLRARSKPKPQVVHPVYRPPATPAVVVHPSVTPATPTVTPTVAKPRVRPKHVAVRRKHLVKPKQTVPAPTQVKKPKPKPTALEQTSITEGGGSARLRPGRRSLLLLVSRSSRSPSS